MENRKTLNENLIIKKEGDSTYYYLWGVLIAEVSKVYRRKQYFPFFHSSFFNGQIKGKGLIYKSRKEAKENVIKVIYASLSILLENMRKEFKL